MNISDDPNIKQKDSYLTSYFLRWDGLCNNSEFFKEQFLDLIKVNGQKV